MIPLAQHPRFADALRQIGRPATMLSNGTLVMHRRFCGVSLNLVNRAVIPDSRDFLKALGALRGPVLINPDRPTPDLSGHGAVPLLTPAATALLDLTLPVHTRRAALHPKWRSALTRAEASDLRVFRSAMPDVPGHWLYRADMALRAARSYDGWPVALTRAFAKPGTRHAVLFTATFSGQPVAAMLFLRHGTGASYHIGHTTPPGRASAAHNLLLWRAAEWLAQHGHRTLDLGLVNSEDAAGLARFKLRSGAQPVRLGGTWLFGLPVWPLKPLIARDLTRMGAVEPGSCCR